MTAAILLAVLLSIPPSAETPRQPQKPPAEQQRPPQQQQQPPAEQRPAPPAQPQKPAPPPASQPQAPASPPPSQRPPEPQAPPSPMQQMMQQMQAGAGVDPRAGQEPPEPIVTHHQARIGGRMLGYTATTGMMPIRNEQGQIDAQIFFIAYTLDGNTPRAERPLLFSFNGGPGSSSVWLHMGALGPRRVKMQDEGWLPPPPYQLVDNEHSLLDRADLVFIDPVGTGFSRARSAEIGRRFWGLRGDIASVGEFIRMYLTRYERWKSPLFVIGESYGTTRAAGLAGYLVDHGIALNGVMLVSTVLQFSTLEFTTGNDLPYPLILPTYTATAWYHKKLPADLQQSDLRKVLAEVERFAATDYTVALQKGESLTPQERAAIVDRLSRYTGLDRRYIDNNDLRVELGRFETELLRDQKKIVGRLDTRFASAAASAASTDPEFDPSMTAIRPPYTSMFADYVRSELGYKSDAVYYILGGGIGGWDFASDNAFAETASGLKNAFLKNPFMKVFMAMGYYDAATPYFAAEYTMDHLALDARLKPNISTGFYEAGHMMYIHVPSLAKFKKDVGAFIDASLNK